MLKPCDKGVSGAPIDFVITWVDGNDPAWQAEKAKYAPDGSNAWDEWVSGAKRYRDWGLLKYWFRGVERFAPWVRTVHFVTWGHVPVWLDVSNPKLHVVRHGEFIPAEYLPTFNSHTIELNMHRIPGLAEQFVYFNDDTFLARETHPENFFKGGLPKDFAGLGINYLNRRRTSYTPYVAMVINDHFDMRAVLRSNPGKWLSPLYGPKMVAKTFVLSNVTRHFPGFAHDHLPINYLRSTFEEVWSVEGEELDRVCHDRFRGFYGISPWLMQDWQRVKSCFVPTSPDLGALFDEGLFRDRANARAMRELITSGRHMKICVNDDCESDEEYEFWGRVARSSFEELLPDKSSFELRKEV